MEEGDSAGRGDLIAQAQGMVSVQAGCSLGDALMLMNARAHTRHQKLEEIAAAIVLGDIRFDT